MASATLNAIPPCSMRQAQRRGHRRVPPRHRPAGIVGPARRAAGAVPGEFQDGLSSRDYLADLLRAFSGYPVAVELRHRSWSDGIGETLALLNAFGAALVQIDEPKFRFSIRQNYLPNVLGFYMRLHGRNAEKWWRHEKSGRALRLSLLGRRAEGILGHRGRREAAGPEALSLHQQSLLREVGGQRRDDQAAARGHRRRASPEFIERYPELAGALTPSRTFF